MALWSPARAALGGAGPALGLCFEGLQKITVGATLSCLVLGFDLLKLFMVKHEVAKQKQ